MKEAVLAVIAVSLQVGARFEDFSPNQSVHNSLVVRVLGYRSGGLGSIPGTTRKKS
jgi:hypothetical protein